MNAFSVCPVYSSSFVSSLSFPCKSPLYMILFPSCHFRSESSCFVDCLFYHVRFQVLPCFLNRLALNVVLFLPSSTGLISPLFSSLVSHLISSPVSYSIANLFLLIAFSSLCCSVFFSLHLNMFLGSPYLGRISNL